VSNKINQKQNVRRSACNVSLYLHREFKSLLIIVPGICVRIVCLRDCVRGCVRACGDDYINSSVIKLWRLSATIKSIRAKIFENVRAVQRERWQVRLNNNKSGNLHIISKRHSTR